MPFGEAESGLLADYKGKITKCEFAFDAMIREGTVTVMFLTFATDSDRFPEYVERYTCGDGWQSYDGGKSVSHPDGKRGFHPNSAAGAMVTAVGKLVPAGELEGRPAHTNADAWTGLAFHMKEHVNAWTNRTTGQEGETRRNLPVEYLRGWEPARGGSVAPSTSPTAPTSAPSTPTASSGRIWDQIDTNTTVQLVQVAKNSDDVASFSRNVLSLEAVTTNSQLLLALTSPETSETYWQELREKE